MSPSRRSLTGWGRTIPTVASVERATSREQVVDAVRRAEPGGRGVIARGLGRSYGDAAQNAGGVVVDMTGLKGIRGIDPERGTVEVDAGVTLDALLRTLLPLGLTVPVLPGTRQVTVGGAIAADVHGKNHHVAGSFGVHVQALDLLTADGEVRTATPDGPDAATFWATVGGMGLTGIVLGASLAVERAETAWYVVDTERADHLGDLMDRLLARDADYPCSVAWFDALASGDRLGRAVITRGRPARVDEVPEGEARAFAPRRLGSVPGGVPGGLVNRLTARAFNELWFRKAPSHRVGELQHLSTFFHPLDAVGEWNRVYGPHGFCQYQLVVPDGAEHVVTEATATIAGSGHVSCLNVLKRFGPGNQAPLSFPQAGWTLAVDLPVVAGLERLLARLDALVVEAGGRVYLAKDSRLPPGTLRRMYPRLDEFEAVRAELDPYGLFRSDLSRRLEMCGAGP